MGVNSVHVEAWIKSTAASGAGISKRARAEMRNSCCRWWCVALSRAENSALWLVREFDATFQGVHGLADAYLMFAFSLFISHQHPRTIELHRSRFAYLYWKSAHPTGEEFLCSSQSSRARAVTAMGAVSSLHNRHYFSNESCSLIMTSCWTLKLQNTDTLIAGLK